MIIAKLFIHVITYMYMHSKDERERERERERESERASLRISYIFVKLVHELPIVYEPEVKN